MGRRVDETTEMSDKHVRENQKADRGKPSKKQNAEFIARQN
jgi:hypothetical protein